MINLFAPVSVLFLLIALIICLHLLFELFEELLGSAFLRVRSRYFLMLFDASLNQIALLVLDRWQLLWDIHIIIDLLRAVPDDDISL